MFGTGELIVILCLILLLFGGKRLPELAKSLGQGVREFKKALRGDDEREEEETDVPRGNKRVAKKVQIEVDEHREINHDTEDKT